MSVEENFLLFGSHFMNLIRGKTYSLAMNSDTSEEYFGIMKDLTNAFLKNLYIGESQLLKLIRENRKKTIFSNENEKIKFINDNLKTHLSKYTTNVKKHLRTMSIIQRFDATLRTKEHQYHLYMIDIELVNRINQESFFKANFKMALLPHCLSDFRPRCLSAPGDIEYICKRCTKDCHINLGSQLLKKYGIEPYIAASMDQRKLLKGIQQRYSTVGVLGIACIPELAQGMQLCGSLGIPAIGIPLDANRCARWMGQAQETSFNLEELEKLIK